MNRGVYGADGAGAVAHKALVKHVRLESNGIKSSGKIPMAVHGEGCGNKDIHLGHNFADEIAERVQPWPIRCFSQWSSKPPDSWNKLLKAYLSSSY